MAKDYYTILGVDRTATEDDIKKAFRKLAHEHHPDKGSGDDTKFKEANEAYQVLGNKDKRQQYDQFGSSFDQMGGQPGGFSWQDMGRAGGSPFGAGGFSQGQQFDFGDIGDVLGDMFNFGGSRTRGHTRTREGNDIQTIISITFDESYSGTEKKLNLNMASICSSCGGSGNDPSAAVETCQTCKGSGTITVTRNSFIGAIRTQSVCNQCEGSGKHVSKKCATCHGSTLQQKKHTLTVKIPPGIDESKTIRLAGKGEAGAHGGPHGDLYIKVTIAEHPQFKRDGYDIKSREEVPLSLLISGGTTHVDSPTGTVKLKIPAHTASGTSFALRGKGFERLTGRGRGDQYVTVQATVPSKLTAKQKKLLAEFEESVEIKGSQKNWW